MEIDENRNKLVGERVHAVRKRFGVTQSQLSKIIGSEADKNNLVRMIEKGQRGLTAQKMQKIVDHFNLNPAYLLLQSEYMTIDDILDADLLEMREKDEMVNLLLSVVARMANYTLKIDKCSSLQEAFYSRIYHFVDDKGQSKDLTSKQVADYLTEVLDYAVYQLDRRFFKKNNSWTITHSEKEAFPDG